MMGASDTRRVVVVLLAAALAAVSGVVVAQDTGGGEYAAVVRRLDGLCTGELFRTAQVGMMVYDLDADRVVYAFSADQRLRPASTMKLVTAITALDQLGTAYTFTTSLYAAGYSAGNTFFGDLYVRGTMDPTLDSSVLDSLAAAVAALQVDTLCGQLLGDRSFFSGPTLGEGWAWDDENPTLAPLLYDGDEWLLPLLRRRLLTQGLVITGDNGEGVVPADSAVTLLYEHRTPLSSLLRPMLKVSNNQYAESVFCALGAQQGLPATAATARQQEASLLLLAGVDSTSYRLSDGSGLSPYNLLTAADLVFLLRYAYRSPHIYPFLSAALPIAGEDGTLRRRLRNGAAKGNVRAKTGTLTGVSTLAGYCTSPRGHTFAFAILCQGLQDSAAAHTFQDAVCTALCTVR